jgi:hypothetical protein
VGNRLGDEDIRAVEEHLPGCSECLAELELAQLILASRPGAPTGLAERVTRAVAADRKTVSRPWWGLTAAAVAALALGIGISSNDAREPVEVPGYAYEAEEGEVWLSDDGLMAGAPVFDGLSEESLLELLDDLSTEAPGGAA